MMQVFYREWAKSCLAAALFLFVVLFSSRGQLGDVLWLIWLQVPIYLLHEFEEHAYPGGFVDFANTKVFKSRIPGFPLSYVAAFWINISFIWIVFPLVAVLAQHCDERWGVILPCFALFNATTHIVAGLVKRCYNPGLFISVILNYPSGIYTLYVMNQYGLLDWPTQLLGWGAALLGHVLMIGYIVYCFKI